ncbi:MAG: hypothetical protein EZS26_001163 [Candidatus Ordinivivax streblomastigis]|uniref:Uncharacterized protein n=1 Tax=Candidatus Ordinivivax streblomastigis TaxID=2540710 RepID=A0A5M8P2V0_9BACT|nr:MAG: hypothetical protein EZS26_001163 [Candidatus Ordinivivax streblomastigis]
MAHNPKLNVYILTLNSKKDEFETFRDLFKLKYNSGVTDEDSKVFGKYFQDFLNNIGKDDFRKDDKAKKVLGVAKSVSDETSYSINPMFEQFTIEGVLDGGKYGILREYADIDNKDDKQILDGKKAVLDKFYICLCTPLNSKYGYLLIQSYTEETIQEPLKNFMRQLFLHEDAFYNIIIEPYVPDRFVEKFQKESKVRLFSYTSKVGVSQILREKKIIVKGQAFEVKIELAPIDHTLVPSSDELGEILNVVDRKLFDGHELGSFKKKVYIADKKERKAHYDIEKELSSIKPTIYLEDEGIQVDSVTGLPDFIQIKEFCSKLLIDIKKEFNKKVDIHEF